MVQRMTRLGRRCKTAGGVRRFATWPRTEPKQQTMGSVRNQHRADDFGTNPSPARSAPPRSAAYDMTLGESFAAYHEGNEAT